MKILVTGANGYIGSKVVKCLCDCDVEVIANDFSFENVDARATCLKADIFSTNENWFEFFQRPDCCLHLAWRDGFNHGSVNHLGDLSFHYRFILNLLENGLSHLAVMGTMHEVGYHEGKIDENTFCNPMSNYGIAKYALRKALELSCTQHNCIFQWLRAYYIFGEDDIGNSIFCKIRKAGRDGLKNFPFTSGKNKYDFIHINDLTMQIAQSVMQDKINGIIEVCSGKPISLAQQVENYIKANKLSIKLDYGKYPDRVYDSPCIYGDNSKIKQIMRNN